MILGGSSGSSPSGRGPTGVADERLFARKGELPNRAYVGTVACLDDSHAAIPPTRSATSNPSRSKRLAAIAER